MRNCVIPSCLLYTSFAYGTPEDFVRFSEENGDDTHTVTSLQVLDTEETRLPDMSYKTPAGKDADIRKAAAKDSHMVLTEGLSLIHS